MKNEHPGVELWNDWIEPLTMTVGEVAAELGVTRKTLSAIINGGQAVSPLMAVRLSKAFGTTAEYWLEKQMRFDLSLVDRGIKVRRLVPAAKSHK